MVSYHRAPRRVLGAMARRFICGLAVAAGSLSPAMAQSVPISAWGYGYAPTSAAAYNIAYAEAEQGLSLNCLGYVSNEYVINYTDLFYGQTWVATVNLGATCS